MNDNIPRPEVVSIPEAARMVRMSVRTVYRMIDEGELPPQIKIRSRSFLPISGVRAYLEKQGLPQPENIAI